MAASRRLETRGRLLECAVEVFSRRGTDGAVIDDFITAAEVSRGTFYNYFATPQDLLTELVGELSDEAVAIMEPVIGTLPQAFERIACGTRLYVRMVTATASFAGFVTRVGIRSGSLGVLTERVLMRDLAAAQAQKMFDFKSLIAARDLIHGTTVQSIESIYKGESDTDDADEALQMALVGLGLSRPNARRACSTKLPIVAPAAGTLLARILSRN